MPRPNKTVDLRDLLDGPVDSKVKSQKRTNRFYKNDLSKLVSGIDLDSQEDAEIPQASSNGHRRKSGSGSRTPINQDQIQAQTQSNSQSNSQPNSQANSHSQPNRKHKPPNTTPNNRKPASTNRSQQRKPNYGRQSSSLKPLTSAEHTNVTCRFIVKSESKISADSLDVDKPIPSKQLWRVFAPVQECPICLETAEVPRMLGCGHIMCYHCMLKHRQFSKTPDVCPICGETVSMSPSRALPVTFLDQIDPPKEDEEVVLTLMSRPAGSRIALPVNLEVSSRNTLPGPDMALYTRVCQASVEFAKQEMAKEVKHLIGASKECIAEFGYDSEGYGNAVAELKREIHSLNLADSAGNNNTAATATNGTNTATPSSRPRAASASASPSGENDIYFYQTSFESPTVYTLSALDVSILKVAFGSFDKFPSSLIAKIQNIDHTVLDLSKDKRMKFLSHLPEQTPVAFIECDWKGVLEPSVLKKFKAKLDERESLKRRQRAKDTAERRRAQHAIDEQFKTEIAEAMVPHESVPDLSQRAIDIDPATLPTLKKPGAAKSDAKKVWVDPRKEYDELMKNAYIPKRGRKNIILRL